MKLRQYDIFGDYVDELVTSTGDDYADFTAKFEPKKTTDDCYTPAPVYDAVLGFCRSQGWVKEGTPVVRPFWPGADYTRLEYPDGCVVVDNPPFSIYAQVVRWYLRRGIKFFLFGPCGGRVHQPLAERAGNNRQAKREKMKAWIDNQRGVGYVVCWLEDRHSVPLRNFGQMQSAAFEFRNWLNRCVDERLPRWVRLYADIYDPGEKFGYPELKENNRPILRRQKYEF